MPHHIDLALILNDPIPQVRERQVPGVVIKINEDHKRDKEQEPIVDKQLVEEVVDLRL